MVRESCTLAPKELRELEWNRRLGGCLAAANITVMLIFPYAVIAKSANVWKNGPIYGLVAYLLTVATLTREVPEDKRDEMSRLVKINSDFGVSIILIAKAAFDLIYLYATNGSYLSIICVNIVLFSSMIMHLETLKRIVKWRSTSGRVMFQNYLHALARQNVHY